MRLPRTTPLLAALAFACGPARPDVPEPSSPEPAPALLAADRDFAAASAARGPDAWAAAWAEDGSSADGDTLVTGPAAVRAHIAPLIDRYGARFRWEPTDSGMLWPDSLGYTTGHAWIDAANGGGTEWEGHYLTIWTRTDEGWKVAFDGSLPACQGLAAAHDFDFWLGDWDVAQRIRAGDAFEEYDARDRVRTAGGCAVVESWRGDVRFAWAGMEHARRIRGASVRVFDPEAGVWRIYWIDSLAGSFGAPFVGRFDASGVGDFYAAPAREGGPRRRIRFERTGGAVDWSLAVETGDGWTPIWTMRFTRR